MKKKEIKLIGNIDFKDVKVNIYNDPYHDKNDFNSIWQVRNQDSCYVGEVVYNPYTNKISYPEGAVIPEQTDMDIEVIPKAIITGREIIDKDFISDVLVKLEEIYEIKNS